MAMIVVVSSSSSTNDDLLFGRQCLYYLDGSVFRCLLVTTTDYSDSSDFSLSACCCYGLTGTTEPIGYETSSSLTKDD